MNIFPNCPICGGKTDVKVSHGAHTVLEGAQHVVQHAARHHPIVGVATLAAVGVGVLWARVAGEKKCERCGHVFK